MFCRLFTVPIVNHQACKSFLPFVARPWTSSNFAFVSSFLILCSRARILKDFSSACRCLQHTFFILVEFREALLLLERIYNAIRVLMAWLCATSYSFLKVAFNPSWHFFWAVKIFTFTFSKVPMITDFGKTEASQAPR